LAPVLVGGRVLAAVATQVGSRRRRGSFQAATTGARRGSALAAVISPSMASR
jgi:hypothetical protein